VEDIASYISHIFIFVNNYMTELKKS